MSESKKSPSIRKQLIHLPKVTTAFFSVTFFAMANNAYTAESVTGVLTDFGGFYESYADSLSPELLNLENNLVGFQQNGAIYSTGVNDQLLTENDITFTPAIFNALVPLEYTADRAGQGSLDDGDAFFGSGLLHPVENNNITAYMTDGINGLGFSTFGNNVQSTTNYILSNIDITALENSEPVFMYFNNASPSSSRVEFKLFNSAGEQLGVTASSRERDHPDVATVSNDRYDTNSPFGAIRENQIATVQGFTQNFNDFGVTSQQLASAVRLEVSLPDTADPPFIAYNSGILLACAIGDDDNDGVCNLIEGDADTDNDGITNDQDADSDNDSIPDIFEGIGDTDGDTIPDYLDTDSDNDGILDNEEDSNMPESSGSDTDSDGIDDAHDINQTGGTDANGNGFDDALEPTDSDSDGIDDYLDSDSDNDGLPDVLEGSVDSDSDGLADYRDTDSDNDGLPDVLEGSVDSDGDGLADFRDTDSDNDGIPDSIENTNTPELLGTDADSDGIDDALDVDETGGTDENNNGIDDALEPADNDNDGIPNHLDTDSDNDGLLDLVESGADTDEDGIPNNLDTDSDNDGWPDTEEGTEDSDGDGVINSLDDDTDNDGILDFIEGNRDSDGDGTPDSQDLDSDNDGIPDATESGNSPNGIDSDGDGVLDYRDIDADNDGLLDVDETTVDTDSSGLPNYLDLDSDQDTLSDLYEAGGTDEDGDGRIDNFVDTNGDGWDDGIASFPLPDPDSDEAGLFDRIDNDSDNDGVSDLAESHDFGVDLDRNGRNELNDRGLISPADVDDQDGDGIPDHLDLDSDNDNVADLLEAGGQDANGDGRVDALTDDDGDKIPNSIDVDFTAGVDADNDGIDDSADHDFNPNFLDTDGDGIIDERDPDGDGNGFADVQSDGSGAPKLSELPDSNANGIADINEPDVGFALNTGFIRSGLSGSGCSISSASGSTETNDPTLPLLGFTALMLTLRRRANTREGRSQNRRVEVDLKS